MGFVLSADRLAATRALSRRIAQRLAHLSAVREREGWPAALLTLSRLVLRSAAFRLRALAARGGPPAPSAAMPADRQVLARPPKPGVLFIGYVEASLGLGQSLRGLIRAAAGTPVPFAIRPYDRNVESRRIGAFEPERYDRENRFRINVMELAGDQLPLLLDYLGPWRVDASRNVLRTYWELPQAPAQWAGALSRVDEIWAPNAFVAEAFAAIHAGPIHIVPPCVALDFAGPAERAAFGLAPDVFYFIFTFDYHSYPARKNPLGLVEAFQAAFPDRSQRVGLILKSTGAPQDHAAAERAVARLAAKDPRIVVIDDTLPRDGLLSLIACSDCYVSLHRSEGFGLAMVEAMLLGKPVIATDFSGSRDFLSQETGFPVAYELRPVKHGDYIFADGQLWAEPDRDSAAAAMRRVCEDRHEAARRAARGQAFVAARYGRAAVGRAFEERVRAIYRGLGEPAPF